MKNETLENSCYMPLGGKPCECLRGDGTTLYIKRVEMVWADSSLLLFFQKDGRPPEKVTDPHDVSRTLSAILNTYIPIAEAAKTDKADIMEFWIDGKNVGLDGAKSLLAIRKLMRKN